MDELPVILEENHYICVCPGQLIRRVTEGLYFDLVGQPDFANSFGSAFEQYVGDVVRKADPEGKLSVLGSMPYGSRSAKKAGSDWIVSDEGTTLFIECKAGRIRSHLKTEMASKSNFIQAVNVLAGYISQLYITLYDAIRGKYKYWEYSGGPLYAMVVTLDDWNHVAINLRSEVREAVIKNISEREIPTEIIDQYPYSVCSIDEFESFIQIALKTGIDGLLSAKCDDEHISWPMGPFLLSSRFSAHRRDLTSLFDWDFFRGL